MYNLGAGANHKDTKKMYKKSARECTETTTKTKKRPPIQIQFASAISVVSGFREPWLSTGCRWRVLVGNDGRNGHWEKEKNKGALAALCQSGSWECTTGVVLGVGGAIWMVGWDGVGDGTWGAERLLDKYFNMLRLHIWAAILMYREERYTFLRMNEWDENITATINVLGSYRNSCTPLAPKCTTLHCWSVVTQCQTDKRRAPP